MKFASLCAMIFLVGSLMASGIGMGNEFGWDTGHVNYDTDWGFQTGNDLGEVSYDSSIKRFGFVMDTNLSKPTLFNYRIKFSYGSIDRNYDEGFAGRLRDEEFNTFSTEHSFGFGIVRNDNFRLWMGPSISVQYAYSDESYSGENEDGIDFEQSRDSWYLDFGFGPTLGANFKVLPFIAITTELSIIYDITVGEMNYWYEDESGAYGNFDWNVTTFDGRSTTFMLKIYPMLCLFEQ